MKRNQFTKKTCICRKILAILEIRNSPLFPLSCNPSARRALMWPLSTRRYCCQPHQSKQIPQCSPKYTTCSSFCSSPTSPQALTKQSAQPRDVCSLLDFIKKRK